MNTQPARRVRGLGLLVLGFLVSCGGGGGSDSSLPGLQPIQEPPAPTVTYAGNRQDVVITQANVSQHAFRALSVRTLVQSVETFWIDVPQGPLSERQTIPGDVSGTAIAESEVDSNGRGYLEAIFQNYSDIPGEVINGRYLQRLRPEAGTPGLIDFSFAGPGHLEFDQLAITSGQVTVTIHGVVRISGVDSDLFQVNLIVSDNQGGETVFCENCRFQFHDVGDGSGPRQALEFEGAVYEQVLGGMQISSLAPIPYFGFNEFAGYLVGGAGGGIEMVADGPLTHVRTISFAYASIIMDMDADGIPETAKRHSWPELAGEPNVETSVMQGPIANAGTRRSPNFSKPVNVHALFSHDDDGDWLTFQWQLLGKPPSSTFSVDSISSQPYFEFTPDVPGDYVFGVRASDGVSSSKTSVVIRHAPAQAIDGSETAAGLEIALPIAVSTPILIDGRSAVNWPYSQANAHWFRTGFGISSFGATGDFASTYLTLATEGLNEIRFSHPTQFAGAPNSSATITLAVGPTIFETGIDLPGDANAFVVYKLDYDNDGDQDLALRVGVLGAERLMILKSEPQGLVPGPDVPAGLGEIAHGDVNGDGLADFLSAASNGLLLFIQAPDHTLLAPQLITYPSSSCVTAGVTTDIALEHVDDDGRLDVMAIHPCDDAIVSWLQQANGSFGAPTSIDFPNQRVRHADFGDANSDGRADIVVMLDFSSSEFQAGVSLFLSQPDGTHVEQFLLERTSIGGMGGSIGDVDGDGRNDIVIVNNDQVVLLRQLADTTFDSSMIFSVGPGPSLQAPVSLVDMDGDGLKDLFFCDSGPGMRMLLQQPGGTFQPVHGPRCQHINHHQPAIAASLDVNNDGQLDLVTITEDHRGAVDERALVKVYLQGVRGYPVVD